MVSYGRVTLFSISAEPSAVRLLFVLFWHLLLLRPSPRAQSADSDCLYLKTYSLLITQGSPDDRVFFSPLKVSRSLINAIRERCSSEVSADLAE